MRQAKLVPRWLMVIAALSLLLTGCATGTASGKPQAAAPGPMEDLLTQAGFKTFQESSPNCQRVCSTLRPDSLVPQKKGDQMAYAYFSTNTRLLYIGDEVAYQTFINLAVAKNLEPRRRAVYETVPNDPEFWTLWENSQGGG